MKKIANRFSAKHAFKRWKYEIVHRKTEGKENITPILAYFNWIGRKWEFGERTDSLVMEAFIQNMNNKNVQEVQRNVYGAGR